VSIFENVKNKEQVMWAKSLSHGLQMQRW
jgi:hypothetical protein